MKAVHVWNFSLRTKSVEGIHALAKALRNARYLTAVQEVVIESTPVEPAVAKGRAKGKLTWKRIEVRRRSWRSLVASPTPRR
jgi:hypothetical protein